jgi:hypothetical protein
MFARIDRRARTLLLRSFTTFAQFIEAVEYAVLHFIQVCIMLMSSHRDSQLV